MDPRSGGGANARPWLWCRGRRSTAPRRPTPSPMTTVRCRPLPLRPGISSSKREVVCCAQAGRTTAHEPSMLAALLLKPRRGIRTRGTTQQRYHQHSLSLPGPLPVRTQLIASCPLSPKASGWDSGRSLGIWNVSSEGRLGVGDRAPAGLDGVPRVQVVHPLRHEGRRQRRQPADRLHRLRVANPSARTRPSRQRFALLSS